MNATLERNWAKVEQGLCYSDGDVLEERDDGWDHCLTCGRSFRTEGGRRMERLTIPTAIRGMYAAVAGDEFVLDTGELVAVVDGDPVPANAVALQVTHTS